MFMLNHSKVFHFRNGATQHDSLPQCFHASKPQLLVSQTATCLSLDKPYPLPHTTSGPEAVTSPGTPTPHITPFTLPSPHTTTPPSCNNTWYTYPYLIIKYHNTMTSTVDHLFHKTYNAKHVHCTSLNMKILITMPCFQFTHFQIYFFLFYMTV